MIRHFCDRCNESIQYQGVNCGADIRVNEDSDYWLLEIKVRNPKSQQLPELCKGCIEELLELAVQGLKEKV